MLRYYTNLVGLEGILKSQNIWATNFHHLSKDKAFLEFFDHKFFTLLGLGIDEGIKKVIDTSRGQEMIKEIGGITEIKINFLNGLTESLTATILDVDVFLASFCYAKSNINSQDELLNQWRKYGHDEGYALIFYTIGLYDLLVIEQEQCQHPFLYFCDNTYQPYAAWFDINLHEEIIEWERSVKSIVSQIVIEGDLQKNQKPYSG